MTLTLSDILSDLTSLARDQRSSMVHVTQLEITGSVTTVHWEPNTGVPRQVDIYCDLSNRWAYGHVFDPHLYCATLDATGSRVEAETASRVVVDDYASVVDYLIPRGRFAIDI